MSTPAADSSATAAASTTYTLDDAMRQANAARTDAATLAANAQAALNKRPIVQSVDSSGNVTQPTNQLIQFGPDPSKATSGAIFISVAS